VKKPDLLVLITIWEFFTAFIAFIGLSAIIMVALQQRTWWFRQGVDFDLAGPWIYFGLAVGGCLLLIYLAAALAAGIGITSGREYGRVLSLVHGGIGLLFFPVGTVVGVLQIVYLTRADVRDSFK
jgi:hypothetical protein